MSAHRQTLREPAAEPAMAAGVAFGSGAGRWVLAVAVLGSGMAFLDGTIVNVALPVEALVAARLFQGIGGALLTPGSLAMIESSFRVGDRPRAIGAWSGLVGVATAVGPLLGGYLVEAGSGGGGGPVL